MPTPPLSEALIREAQEAVLRRDGNKTLAARDLGIPRGTLNSRLEAGAIERAEASGLSSVGMADTPGPTEADLLRQENERLKKALRGINKDALSEEEIRRTIFGLAEQIPNPPSWIAKPEPRSRATQLAPIAMWSDWHYGERVNPAECAGNKFGIEVAKARVERLVERTIDFPATTWATSSIPASSYAWAATCFPAISTRS